MARRRKRVEPSGTELQRVERVLENDPAVRRLLGPKDTPARKRNGDVIFFSAATMAITTELMTRRLNPERVHIGGVLAVAVLVLGIGRRVEERDTGPL
jgi:hypothetical protein